MKVELLAYTHLVDHSPNPEALIEKAARLCYNSKPGDEEKRKKFLTGPINSGHTSTIEHASATFKISEVSRALTHELVRHRIGMSYSQRSQRYCSEDGFEIVVPDLIKKNDFEIEYKSLIKTIEELYNEMVADGVPKEDARYILPNACHTQIIVTGNFTAWRHFLELRLSPRAQWEIRQLAHLILNELYKIAPVIFQDLKDKYDGTAESEQK